MEIGMRRTNEDDLLYVLSVEEGRTKEMKAAEAFEICE